MLFWNGLGGFTGGWPRVRDRHRRHPPRRAGLAAGPLDQRAGQPGIRMPGDRGRPGLHLGGQQPDEPPHPVVERPGFGPAGRGDLPARRGDRRGLDAHAPAVRATRGHHRPPWPGLHPLHPRQSRAGSGRCWCSSRPTTRSSSCASRCETTATGRAACRRRITPNGCSAPSARTPRCRWSAERDPETGAVLARNAWAGSFAGQIAFLAAGPSAPVGDRGSHGIPRPQRFRVRTRRAGAGRPLGPRRPGARPGRGGDDGHRAGPRRGDGGRLRPGPGGKPGTGPPPRRRLHRRRPSRGGAGRGAAAMGSPPERRAGEDARSRHGPDAQPLAALPGAGLPGVGPLGVLPIGRGVRLPGPAPGRHGPGLRRPGRGTCADPAVGGPAIRGGRRPALVASADRASASAPGSPTISTSCPWSSTTTSPRPATRSCSTRWCRSSSRRCSAPDQEEDFNLPELSEQSGTVYEHCVRALEHGYRTRAARIAADGHRRLERRHEQGGRRGQGRERLERLVLRHGAERVRDAGRAAGRRGSMRAWCRERAEALRAALEANAWDGAWYRRAYFDDGTPLGSAPERRMPDRRDPAGLGGDLRRRGPGAGPIGDGRGRGAPGARRRQADPALRPAVRQGRPAARLHQGLCAGHPRERRPVHPRGHLGRAGDGAAGPTGTAPWSCGT